MGLILILDFRSWEMEDNCACLSPSLAELGYSGSSKLTAHYLINAMKRGLLQKDTQVLMSALGNASKDAFVGLVASLLTR